MLKNIYNLKIFVIAILFWCLFTYFYLNFAKVGLSTPAGFLALIGQVGLDIFAATLTYQKSQEITEPTTKNIYFIFFVSFVAACFSDGIYNLTTNVFDIKYSSDINSLFEIPFVVFLLFQVIAWGKMFFNETKFSNSKNIFAYFSYSVIAILILSLFIFGIPWQIQHFSLLGVYQIIDTILEVIGFLLATICLARARNKIIYLTAMGYLVIISSDILIRYSVVSGATPFLNFFESTWVLGLLLMSIGFSIPRKPDITLLPLNGLQSNIAIWTLNICLLFLTLFSVATHLYSGGLDDEFNHVNKILLSILIPFSCLAIIVSKYLSFRISRPLEEIEYAIRKFSSSDFSDFEIPKRSNVNSMFEFETLENFVHEAFSIFQKNRIIEREISTMATQVAHDIQSPIAVLELISQTTHEISDSNRIILKDAISRVRDIGSNLLCTYRKYKDKINLSGDIVSNEPLVPHLAKKLIESILAEKRLEFRSKPEIKILDSLNQTENDNLFVKVQAAQFKRILSNIINNSVESIAASGFVNITLSQVTKNIEISIHDNGVGIPSDVLSRLGEQGKSYGKPNGNGLGIYHARKTISEYNGKLEIESKLNEGTTVKIILPKIDPP